MSTVYADIDPRGLGATLDSCYSPGVTRVVVCGPRPGHGKSGAMQWAEQCGRWFPTEPPHITRSTLRGRWAQGGVTVAVTRAEPWFGGHPADTVADAAPVVRHLLMKHHQPPLSTPGRTGVALLARTGADEHERCSADVGALLRATSGQGRFQVWPTQAGTTVSGVDARLQYGALALTELPVGAPVRGVLSDDPYAPSWCHVEFTPRPNHVAMLPVQQGKAWVWPTEGTNWQTWATGAEIHAARNAGYRIRVLDAVLWPRRARPLARWARALVSEREHVAAMPLRADVIDCARGALRSVLVQTVGSLHRAGSLPSFSATAEREGSDPGRPEWSTALWGLARCRLATQLARQTAPLVACALDGYYVAGTPETDPDDGKPGRWRTTGVVTLPHDIANLADLYRAVGKS